MANKFKLSVNRVNRSWIVLQINSLTISLIYVIIKLKQKNNTR